MLYQIYFSPTGGTKKVADIMADAWPEIPQPIDLADPTETFSRFAFQPQDVCLVAVPSFGGRIPAVVSQRLGQMTGGGAQVILICVYGNRAYEDTLVELQDVLTERGFLCCAAVAAIAQHSIMRQFAAGRPDDRDRLQLSAFAAQIRDKLAGPKPELTSVLPGNRPYKPLGTIPMVPKGGKGCSRCGFCAAKCPVGAIDLTDPTITDKTKCISCMQCVSICPQHTRKVNPALVFAASQKMKKVCSVPKENELYL